MKTKTNNPRSARSLTTTLAIAFFTLSVVTLLVNGSFVLYTNYKSYQESIAAQQELVAQDASKSVASFIQDKFNGLESAVRFANPVVADPEIRKTIMGNLLGLDPAFRQFVSLDSNGRQLAQISRTSPTLSSQFTSQLKEDLINQTSKDQYFISPIYIDDMTSEPLITIAVPIKNDFGDFQGVLAAEVDLKFMWDLVDQLKVGETGYAYVVDSKGDLIAFGDTARVLSGENVKQIKEVNEFVENPAMSADTTPGASAYTGLLGKKVVGTYVPLGTPEWAVVTELPTAEAYQPIFQTTAIAVGGILLLAVLAGLAGVIVARQLAVPLVDLTGTATRIANGETYLQAKVTGPKEVATLGTAFNSMTVQLQNLIGNLEQRVADRTKALTTSVEVSQRLTSILDPIQLAREVVNQVQTAFNYYYAQIYLFDDAGENLVLAAGTGEAGTAMMDRGHSIPKGRGLVGRAAQNKESVLVADTAQDPDWLPNPLLPDTKAEVAIPIAIGDKVLGVLDVQDDGRHALTLEDVTLLESLGSQIAISLQNARQYLESTQFRMGIENSGDAVFATDRNGIITYANHAFEQVYGYSPAEVIGKNPRIIKSGLLSQEIYSQFWQTLLSKHAVTGEIINKHKDGHLIYIAGTNSAIVNNAGDISGFLAVHHDITEQRKNQDQVAKRSQQQETINAITQRIQSTATIEQALQVAARELGHALGMRQTLVTLDPAALAGNLTVNKPVAE